MDKRKKEIVLYLLFGGLTTVVGFVTLYLFAGIFGDRTILLANTLSWVAAVTFAYVTNKLWVFESRSWGFRFAAREFRDFTAARLVKMNSEKARVQTEIVM